MNISRISRIDTYNRAFTKNVYRTDSVYEQRIELIITTQRANFPPNNWTP